jgi:hypothetical protein
MRRDRKGSSFRWCEVERHVVSGAPHGGQIDTMLVETPRRYFEHNAAY